MCRKIIYHNTYINGDTDVTERVECCYPGRVCPDLEIVDVDRKLRVTKVGGGGSSRRASPAAYDRDMYPPTPQSGSPRLDGGAERKYHKRGQDIYVGGTRVVEVNDHTAAAAAATSSRRRRSDRRQPPIVLANSSEPYQTYAPAPPSPRPIPIKRSSTMTYGIDTPPREETRGRRPIIVEDRAPLSSRRAPGAVDILEHSTSGQRLHRRPSSRRDSAFLTPSTSRHERSPQGYASAEDEQERRERRRIRHERRAQAAAFATSAPTSHSDALYGSSFGSSYPSSPSSGMPSPRMGGSAAVNEVKKHLRWEDELRAKQNAKIDSRPKLSRSNTTGGAGGVQTEVKSILKNAGQGQQPAQQQPDGMAELYSSMEGLGIRSRPSSRDKRHSRHQQQEELALDREEAEYQERLRNRFSIPPRRYTSIGPQRRSEVWYPDEGRYKYL